MMESKGGIIMPATKLTEADVARAEQIWADYQRDHDVSDRIGRAAGIDPFTGRIWFGESIADIWSCLKACGVWLALAITEKQSRSSRADRLSWRICIA